MKKQITVDLETLGRNESAFFVQIAAVEFDEDGNVIDYFNQYVDFESYMRYPFTMDINTVVWWLGQSKESQEKVFSDNVHRTPIEDVLALFEDWILGKGECNIWQHSSFDVPKINYAIKEVLKHDQRINFYYWKDIRTLTETTGIPKPKMEKGVAHDALDDCVHQAHYISKCLKEVKK